MKIIDNVRKNKVLAGAIVVLVIVVMVVVTMLGIGDKEATATASSGNASAGDLKKDQKEESKKKKSDNSEEETTSSPSTSEEQETVMQVTVTSDDTTVIQNPDGTTSTLNPGETLNIVKEVINENGEKMYQLDNGGYVSAEKVSNPVTKPVSNPTVNSNSANNPQTDAPTVSQEQSQTPAPTPKPTEAPTPKPTEAPTPKPTEAPTQAPTEAPTQPQNPWLTYEGYREEEIEIFKQKLTALRQEHYGGYSTDYAVKYSNPQWNDTLYRIAKERAREIAKDFPNNYTHTSAGNYFSGYNVGDNLSYGYVYDNGYAEDAYAGWYQSIDHRNFLISGGDQYAVAFYQKGGVVYSVFVAGDTDTYCAANYASYYSVAWKELGLTSQKQAYDYLYNDFVSAYGMPIIR